jgi:hypothetical protein
MLSPPEGDLSLVMTPAAQQVRYFQITSEHDSRANRHFFDESDTQATLDLPK